MDIIADDPKERIDVLTEGGKATGRWEERKTVHSEGLWHRTVHIWIVSPEKKVLLQKRAPEKQTHPDLWDMACAGHISAGETSLDAAVKEVREELGLSLSPADFTHLFTHKDECIHHDGRYIDREFHDIYLVFKHIPLSSITVNPSEVSTVKYLPLSEFFRLVEKKDPGLVPHAVEYARFKRILSDPAGLITL